MAMAIYFTEHDDDVAMGRAGSYRAYRAPVEKEVPAWTKETSSFEEEKKPVEKTGHWEERSDYSHGGYETYDHWVDTTPKKR